MAIEPFFRNKPFSHVLLINSHKKWKIKKWPSRSVAYGALLTGNWRKLAKTFLLLLKEQWLHNWNAKILGWTISSHKKLETSFRRNGNLCCTQLVAKSTCNCHLNFVAWFQLDVTTTTICLPRSNGYFLWQVCELCTIHSRYINYFPVSTTWGEEMNK